MVKSCSNCGNINWNRPLSECVACKGFGNWTERPRKFPFDKKAFKRDQEEARRAGDV